MRLIKLIKFILYVLLKPRKLKYLGEKSIIHLPYKINHPQYISIGKNTVIHESSLIHPVVSHKKQAFSPEITIGNNVYVGSDARLHAINKIIIEDNCVISDYVYINDALHSIAPKFDNIMDGDFYSKGQIIIREGCFIGYDVAILSGVILGKHCIVATKSVVTKSFPDFSMIAGNPAVIIKKYCIHDNTWKKFND